MAFSIEVELGAGCLMNGCPVWRCGGCLPNVSEKIEHDGGLDEFCAA